MIVYISGIHTDVGKTHFSAAFCHAFGLDYFKLIQAGTPRDCETIRKFSPNTRIFEDGYFLKTAQSPHIAKRIENADYSAMDIKIPDSSNLAIEIAGGLYSPICDKYCMLDYMRRFNFPTILVARPYLGCVNHTLLSALALRQSGVKLLCVAMIGDNIDMRICDFLRDYANVKIARLGMFDTSDFSKKAMALRSEIIDLGIF